MCTFRRKRWRWRWQQAALVEALARLEGILGRLRDKAAKALVELKECTGRMQK
jgi:hypothetical protein